MSGRSQIGGKYDLIIYQIDCNAMKNWLNHHHQQFLLIFKKN